MKKAVVGENARLRQLLYLFFYWIRILKKLPKVQGANHCGQAFCQREGQPEISKSEFRKNVSKRHEQDDGSNDCKDGTF